MEVSNEAVINAFSVLWVSDEVWNNLLESRRGQRQDFAISSIVCSSWFGKLHQSRSFASKKDADGFEIPSLNTGKPGPSRKERLESEKSSRAAFEKVKSKPENIYLGPHGAPPKAQDASNPTNRKQKLKHKLKDAERRGTILGRENKVEVIRDLMGGKAVSAPREPSEGWLEAYCHENQFERSK